MRKRLPALLLAVLLCFCCAAAEEETETLADSFRDLPGYTCFPLMADGDFLGTFCVDCPMEWDGGDYSESYRIPTVMAIDPDNPDHHVMITQITVDSQLKILQYEDHPLIGFLWEGGQVTQGRSTENSKIIEQFDLHGLSATRVEMVGQGYEMIWVVDRPADWPVGGDMWFFMYPTDPGDPEYTGIVAGIVDSFTVCDPAFAGTAPASDFDYTADGGEICVTAYTGKNLYVRIPSEIDGKPVTSLGDNVFYETAVRYVSMPDSVRTIGSYTFGGCTHLVFAEMPASLEVLPFGTFESCFRLADPGLNRGLKKIESCAFWGNEYLTELYLPGSLEEIEDSAFVMCDYLDNIYAANNSPYFRNNEDYGILFSADGTKLIHYSYLYSAKEYKVPDGVKQIYAYAFNRANLTGGLTLPEGLEYIGYGAFTHTGLTELRIPESATEIGIMKNVYVDGSDEPTDAYTSISETLKIIRGVAGSRAEAYAEAQQLEFIPD